MDVLDFAKPHQGEALAGFLGLVLYKSISVASEKWKARTFRRNYESLCGVWIEANDILDDRPFAICEFSFSPFDGKLKFGGDSYGNDAIIHYKWWSVSVDINQSANRLSYFYETQVVREDGQEEDKTQKSEKPNKDEGFGCIFLQWKNGGWVAREGFFLDLGERTRRNARMRRFSEVAEAFDLSLKPDLEDHKQKLIKHLIHDKKTERVKRLFGW